MRRLATTLLVTAGLVLATGASALDLNRKVANPTEPEYMAPFAVNAVLGCDNGNFFNAYFQATDDRLGNVFNFGSGSLLSAVTFVHFGYGFQGPYNYDLEVWDPSSCTIVVAKSGLVAADAAANPAVEIINTCGDQFYLTGNLAVMIDPNTCLDPTDCYPDLAFDNQLDVFCPFIINNATTSPACFDVSPFSGPFLLRVDVDNCPVPARPGSWGDLKAIYR